MGVKSVTSICLQSEFTWIALVPVNRE